MKKGKYGKAGRCKACESKINSKKYYSNIEESRKKNRDKMAIWKKGNEKALKKIKEYNKKYYHDNKDKEIKRRQEYYRKNISSELEKARKRNEDPAYRMKWNRSQLERRKARLMNDESYRVKTRLRVAIKNGIARKNNYKSSKSEYLLGCSFLFAYDYLKNMGYNEEIHDIDHIIPLARFNFKHPYHALIAFNYKNLQPLEKSLNRSKQDSLESGWEAIIKGICKGLNIDSNEIISYVHNYRRRTA